MNNDANPRVPRFLAGRAAGRGRILHNGTPHAVEDPHPAQDELLKEAPHPLAPARRPRAASTRHRHQEALDRSIEQLDELFLLVVIGEFNAGKSAFINALLGSRVVAEGVTPTTAQINVLQ